MPIQRNKSGETVFVFDQSPSAKQVYLAGDFNQWDETGRRMRKVKDGTFKARMKLSPGEYSYKFLVDGIWQHDQDAEQRTNSFGTTDSVVRI